MQGYSISEWTDKLVSELALPGEVSTGNILIVAQAAEQSQVLSAMLLACGYTIVTAEGGGIALELAREHRPDLILLAVALPDVTGYELCRRFKRNDHTCDIPIIFVGTPDAGLDRSAAFAAGGVDYLYYPLQLEEVVVRVQTHLRLRQAQAELRQREAIYQAMFAKNWAVKLLIDPDTGVIIDANPAACAFYGYALDQLRRMKITDINTMPPGELHAEMERAKTERLVYFRFRHRRASGEVRNVEVYTGPIELRGRTLLYSIIHDITDRVRAEDALLQTHNALEQRVAERTAELVAANQALQAEIAERTRAEQALRESEARYRRLTENAPDIIYRYRFHPVRGFEYVSPVATTLTGYTPEEHYADPDLGLKLIHPDDQPLLMALLQDARSCTDPLVLRWIRKDRVIVWIEQRNVPIFDEHGTLVAIDGIARDVTERLQQEAELRKQKTLLESQSEASPDGILVVAPDGQILTFNQRFVELWCMPQELLLTRNAQSVLPSILWQLSEPEQFVARIEYLYNHPSATSRDEIVLKDGRIFDRYTGPIRGSDGVYYGRIWFYRDVTTIRQGERALHESYNLLENILASLNESVIVVNPVTRLILDCNPETERIFGYSRHELVGQETDFLHVNREMFLQFGSAAMRAYETTGFFETEYQMRRKNGELFPTEHFVSPIYDDTGKLMNVVSIVRDITERKRTEEDLKRRNHQLAVLNRMTEAVNRSLDLTAILTTLKQLLIGQMHIVAGAIYLYNEADDHLVLEVAWGLPPAMEQALTHFPVTTAYHQRVVWEQTPIFLPDLPADVPLLRGVLHQNHLAECSYLSIPLLAQDEVQGAVDLFSPPSSAFHGEQVTFFAMLGQQVGSAIQKARLFEQLTAGRERLQTLSRRLVEVQETERRTIARELHDEVGQILTGLSLLLEMVARLPNEQIPQRLEQAREMVNDLMQRVRELSLQLRPPMLDDLGLLAALLWHFERYTSQTGIKVVFKHINIERRFRPNIEIAVYRMVQEALTNVARYASVPQVTVRLWVQHATLGVQIEDQGRGFEPEAALTKHASSGLSGMRERLLLLGGELAIESAPGAGCRLSVELPLP